MNANSKDKTRGQKELRISGFKVFFKISHHVLPNPEEAAFQEEGRDQREEGRDPERDLPFFGFIPQLAETLGNQGPKNRGPELRSQELQKGAR